MLHRRCAIILAIVKNIVCNNPLLAFFMVANRCTIILKVNFSEAKRSNITKNRFSGNFGSQIPKTVWEWLNTFTILRRIHLPSFLKSLKYLSWEGILANRDTNKRLSERLSDKSYFYRFGSAIFGGDVHKIHSLITALLLHYSIHTQRIVSKYEIQCSETPNLRLHALKYALLENGHFFKKSLKSILPCRKWPISSLKVAPYEHSFIKHLNLPVFKTILWSSGLIWIKC